MMAGDVGAAPYASELSYDEIANITFISSGMGNMTNEKYIICNVHASKKLSYEVICLTDTTTNSFGSLEDYT